MVLKKSRSCLNSGATLRLTKGRAFIGDRLYFHANIFNVSVTPTHYIQIDEEDKLSRVLGNIWDYLGWQGPHLSKIIQTTKNYRWQHLGKFSLRKSKRHDLPDRLNSLMTDVEFLQDLLPDLEIHYRRKQQTLNTRYVYRQTDLESSKIIEKSLHPTDETEKKKSRSRSHFKNRGIQRPYVHRMHEKKKRTEQEFVKRTSLEQPVARLNLELCEAVHVDPRSVKGNNISSRFETRLDWRCKKSSQKAKGCVNGRYGWKKGYTLADMRDDIQMSENYFYDDSDIMTNDSYPRFNYNNNFTNKRGQTYSLSDFIKENKMAANRCRHKPAKEEECHDVGWKQKYPKGSFIVMPKEEIMSSSLNMSSWELVDTNDLNPSLSLDEDLKEKQSLDLKDSDLSQNVQENNQKEEDSFKTEIFDFDNSFFSVELVMSTEEKQIFTVDNRREKSMEIKGLQIKVAGSFPPSFVLHLHTSDNPDQEMESYVIGRQLDIAASSWLISVQGDNCQKLRERMITSVKREWSGFPCLSDLIHIVLEIERDKICSDFEVCSEFSISQDSDTDSLRELLPRRPSVIICSAEAAYLYLQKHHHQMNQQEHHHQMNQQEHHHHINQHEHHFDINESLEDFKITYQLSPNDVDKSTFECDVCYLRCDISINSLMLPSCCHMFCISCWRSHLYHSIRHGATQLTCMATQCTAHVDVTTAMTILPHTRVKQWLQFVRDKYLQVSPFCAWCPGDACSRVAVSLTQPLRSQFGLPITCDCNLSWCSNCQKQPHWPASCDQMSAYNTLLDKVWGNPNLSFGMVNYEIQLKRCPKCHYPIEINNGCPIMHCAMCSFRFCWNCFQDETTHDMLECQSRLRKSVKFNLQNEIFLDLPVKFFLELLDLKKKQREINQSKLRAWVKELTTSYVNERKGPKTSVCKSSKSDCPEKIQIVHLAKECYIFLELAYNTHERILLLLSFVNTKNNRNVRHLYEFTLNRLSQLQFICSRLHENVLGKSPRQISKFSNVSRSLLKSGSDVISQMTIVAPALQQTFKDSKTVWMGELDPKNFMRYK